MPKSAQSFARIAWLVCLGMLIAWLQASADDNPIDCDGLDVINRQTGVLTIDGGGEAVSGLRGNAG